MRLWLRVEPGSSRQPAIPLLPGGATLDDRRSAADFLDRVQIHDPYPCANDERFGTWSQWQAKNADFRRNRPDSYQLFSSETSPPRQKLGAANRTRDT